MSFFQFNYLGHVISKKGIAPDPEKTEKIASYNRPRNVTELHSFLGLASYYRRLILEFAKIAHPLTTQTSKKKEETLEWGNEEQKAFEELRNCFITPPILAFPDFDKEFQVFTDASNYGVGAVVSQNVDDGEKVIAYASNVGVRN